MENKIKFAGILILGIVIVLLALTFLQKPFPPSEEKLKKFGSLNELKNFLKESSENGYYGGVFAMEGMVTKTTGTVASAGEKTADYSQTNIQVIGVDEADIVKNDGKYIYAVSDNKVVIIDAYPAEDMRQLSEIEVKKGVNEIFINKNKLVIFSNSPVILVYDISDREKPKLEHEINVDGYYVDSRMIKDYVYVISQKYINIDNPEPPVYILDGVEKKVKVNEVYYFPYPNPGYVFTSVMAVNVNSGDFETKTFLTGSTNNVYVSQNNIFLTGQKYIGFDYYLEKYVEDVIEYVLPYKEMSKIKEVIDLDEQDWEKMSKIQKIIQEYSDSLEAEEKEEFDKELMEKIGKFQIKISKQTEKTIIHKINVKKGRINYEASGEVPGNVLNQFSMDEFQGNFRIATTTGSGTGISLNHLYVLDDDLKIIGKVEDLAKGERIYSARFLGKRAYMVTFKKIDPLFVIDLSIPEKPKVLGYLKITGYSDYLHPYDENHIIGIGKETRGGNEFFSWYQGIKISLFDVSNIGKPIEKAKIEIGDRGTDSYVLRDHKAFLFDKEKSLLVLPVLLAEINETNYGEEIPDYAYGEPVWQGAYVLDITLNNIDIRGRITHKENRTELDRWGWYNDKYSVKRSLYMDDYLYTISSGKIKANDLYSLDEISSVELVGEEPTAHILK